MYLKKIHMENYGSIEKIDYQLPFHQNGNPKPVVIIGKNGSGKTLMISNIVHSLIEMKKKGFDDIPETDLTKYYRIGSKDYIRVGTDYSYVKFDYSNQVSYIDTVTRNYNKIKDLKLVGVNYDDEGLINDGFYNEITSIDKKQIKEIFSKEVFLYLPVDRYYSPKWLNNLNNKLEFNPNFSSYVGINSRNIIKGDILKGIESWILDVIIDKMLYEQAEFIVPNVSEGKTIEKHIWNYKGKNARIQNSINKVLTDMLHMTNPEIKSARFGISRKKVRQISAIYSINDREYEYVPSFNQLSSGEVMVLGMLTSILKEFDGIVSDKDSNFEEVQGIVVIDEIDAHLHLDFCRLILPEMMAMFPKIQFIVTSHSQFFLLGMKEKFGDNCEFLNMPSGTLNEIDNFEEIKKMYDLVQDNYEKVFQDAKRYKEQLEKVSEPVIITEGKTDWKHLKRAKEKLNNQDDFKFFECDGEMGDTAALAMLKEQAKISNSNKRIFIFDNDNEKIIREISNKGEKYKDWGNNVYSFVIPKPGIRTNEDKISIEHYYPDEVLKKEVEFEGGIIRRVYCGDDFQSTGISTVLHKRCNKKDVCGTGKIRVLSGIEQERVYDLDNEDNNSINYALTKDAFFEKVINNDENDIDMSKFNLIFDIIHDILTKT